MSQSSSPLHRSALYRIRTQRHLLSSVGGENWCGWQRRLAAIFALSSLLPFISPSLRLFFFSLFRTTHAQNSRGESAGQKGKALCREDPEKIWVAVFLCNEFKSNRRCHFRLLLRRCATVGVTSGATFFPRMPVFFFLSSLFFLRHSRAKRVRCYRN